MEISKSPVIVGKKRPKEWTNEKTENIGRKGACVVLKRLIIQTCYLKGKKCNFKTALKTKTYLIFKRLEDQDKLFIWLSDMIT